jgi:hypothetical protein
MSKSVMVPESMSAQTIHHKISQNLKHGSVIAYISATRESLIPYIVTSQDSLPVRENLKKRGRRFGSDFVLKARSKLYINAEFFINYILTMFLPNRNELQVLEEFADEDAAF